MSLSQSLGTLVGAITLFIGSIIMMFYTNWILAITGIVSSLLGFVAMFVIMAKSQKYFNARQVELGKLNGHIEEIYSNHNVVNAYNGQKEASETFDKLNQSVYECNKKSRFLSGLSQPIMSFIGNFSYVAVCVVGAILTMNGSITFGVIVAFMMYIRLFTGPLTQIAQGMTNLQTTAAASERVFEFLEEPEMDEQKNITKHLDPAKVEGNIVFDHIKFSYDGKKTVIKDFSCDVKKGQKVAIVGPTGAGKTTMVNLLMKFYNIADGNITIDGVSTKELSRENIHDLFIMVLQDTWLFNGTVRDNIKYNKEVSDEDIMKACKTVGIDKFIKTLGHGEKEFEKVIAKLKQENKKIIDGQTIFKLYETYGFPPEITADLAREQGFEIDTTEFDTLFKQHQEKSRLGSEQKFKGGLAEQNEITTAYHTATHLLHKALRIVLGDHVKQSGSNITTERLRFDFSHPEKMTPEQLKQVEEIVNEQIKRDLPVISEEMSLEDAKKSGAIGLFENKYGDVVKVYTIGDFSKEICGGPHVKHTGELGHFKIKKEESSSAGIRRIKAVLE